MRCNKVAVVTGASRGIGKAISEEFASRGYSLGLISRNYDGVNKVSEELINKYDSKCIGFGCNVCDEGCVVDTFFKINSKLGGLDVLVNNAGINSRGSLKFISLENWFDNFPDSLARWKKELDVNLTGSYICSYIAVGYMLEKGEGSIINISSIKGKEATSSPGYGASKAGVIKLTRDFAKVFAPYYIRVNCVSPGFIDTGMTSGLSDEKREMYKKNIPENRFGSVEEIARVVAFLASNESSYICGETINVNGGYLMD